MITVNDIRYAVNLRLRERFPGMPIRGEEIKQGLVEPCFFVRLFPVAQEQELGRRYRRYHSFDIHYFPESQTAANDEMHNIAEGPYDCMEYITVNGGLVRGTGTNHEIINNVLHFFVDYDIHVKRPKPDTPTMQTLDQEGYIK